MCVYIDFGRHNCFGSDHSSFTIYLKISVPDLFKTTSAAVDRIQQNITDILQIEPDIQGLLQYLNFHIMILLAVYQAALSIPILFTLLSLANPVPFESSRISNSHFQSPRLAAVAPLSLNTDLIPRLSSRNNFLNPHSSLSSSTSVVTISVSDLSTNALSRRSLSTIPGVTIHFLERYVGQPTTRLFNSIAHDVNDAMYKFKSYVATIESYAPRSSYRFTLGKYQLTFYSPLPIAWNFVTGIIESHILLGLVMWAVFGRVLWVYATGATVLVTMGLLQAENGAVGNIADALREYQIEE